MGKTPKPLVMIVDQALYDQYTDEFDALRGQGHTINVQSWDVDLLIGPRCWRLTPELMPHLATALKGVRAVKYPKKGGT